MIVSGRDPRFQELSTPIVDECEHRETHDMVDDTVPPNVPFLLTEKVIPASEVQVGGRHYADMPVQPAYFIHANSIPYIEGAVIKYICRWRTKNGIEDLRKARHYIDLLIEYESNKQ